MPFVRAEAVLTLDTDDIADAVDAIEACDVRLLGKVGLSSEPGLMIEPCVANPLPLTVKSDVFLGGSEGLSDVPRGSPGTGDFICPLSFCRRGGAVGGAGFPAGRRGGRPGTISFCLLLDSTNKKMRAIHTGEAPTAGRSAN